MEHLDEITVEELQDALDNVERKKPAERLVAAIAYKNGVTQDELSERYDVRQKTIYRWLKRLDTDESLEHAVANARRLGRKRKLSETQQQEFEETVHDPPEAAGDGRHRSLYRPNQEIRPGRAAWFPRGTRPSVELSGQRDWTCLLGAITGDRLFSRFEEYVTADHANHLILALCEEFEDGLLAVLDGAPYFQASAVTDLAARDDLAFVTLPSYSPESNPAEECWRQLQAALSNRCFGPLDKLTTAIDSAPEQLSLPEVSN
jgi:transposase/DNA-binding PadR family transcriptional regulator